MSELSETSGRPLASTTTKQLQLPEGNTLHQQTPAHTRHRKNSQSSDEQTKASNTSFSRRRPEIAKQASPGPRTGSSRSEQRSTSSPTNMASQLSSVHYTRTGRISKAKKGLKVHNCENCGRSYTRAEHLRRHQKNHAQDDALVCEYPDCGKIFYRLDLLNRHQERHNEPGKESRQHSVFSQEGSPEAIQVSVPALVPSGLTATLPPTPSPYYPTQPISPMHDVAAIPSHTKQRNSYSARPSVALPVGIEAMTPSLVWPEPCSQSPGYSPSSGHASPVPYPGDYSNIFANPPYGPNRTRTASEASLMEPWLYPSRSPTSVASTMAYPWPSNEKPSTAPGLAYMTSYPMMGIHSTTSIDSVSGYGHFNQKTMMDRDAEEGVLLFGEQPYGMGPLTHTYPFEQYLDYYWRLLHPTFPVVHRSTFERISPSPLLHASMIALGGQYSDDTSVRRESSLLHDRCMKVLEKRDQEQHLMAQPDRLCDYQAMFLIEVHSQYRARRAARSLSSRFEKVYRKSAEDFRLITSQMIDSVAHLEDAILERWDRWCELATWQNLLLSCYILESQQALLLAREPSPSLFHGTGLDLPFPGSSSLWTATNPTEWAGAVHQNPHLIQYVYEVTADSVVAPFDSFQSSLLLAAHYNHFDSPAPYISSPLTLDFEHLLDTSPTTTQKLLTAKLVQVTPIRALLAVAGKSWILSEKLPSIQAFSAMKTTLRTWIAQLWPHALTDARSVPVKAALKLSVDILEHALKEQQDSLTPEMGTDMGIYFAALVLWATTCAANTRVKGPHKGSSQQPQRRQSQPPRLFSSTSSASVPSTPTQLRNQYSHHTTLDSSQVQVNNVETIQSQPSSPGSHASIDCNTLLSHAQITINTITFLSTAMIDFGSPVSTSHLPMNIARCQTGCISLLLWVKLRLRGIYLDPRNSVPDAWTRRTGESLGELLDSVTGSLESMMTRGWDDWGI